MSHSRDTLTVHRWPGTIRLICLILSVVIFSLPVASGQTPNDDDPLVYVNHVYLCLDSATYTAVCNCDFLKDTFGSCTTKTVVAEAGQSWTGTFVFGEDTYIEFFNLGGLENAGYSGIGFGVEVVGGVDQLYGNLGDSGSTNMWRNTRSREIDGVEIPWFEMCGFTREDTTARFITNTWIMEYKREYMATKYPDLPPDSMQITRKCYNQLEYRSDLLLNDILEIELAVDDPDFSRLLYEFKKYGYQTEQEEGATVATGPDIRLILRPKSENQAGVCRIKFSLNDIPYEQRTEVLSDYSKLVLNADKTAEWYFTIK